MTNQLISDYSSVMTKRVIRIHVVGTHKHACKMVVTDIDKVKFKVYYSSLSKLPNISYSEITEITQGLKVHRSSLSNSIDR